MSGNQIQVPIPTYDWQATDELRELRLFSKQLNSWLQLEKIKEDDRIEYTLQILGKEGYAAMDCWTPQDADDKKSVDKFLQYLTGTLDNEISQCICVYDLEDIKKKDEESVDKLMDQIQQMARLAQIRDNSDEAIKFEVQCQLI